MTYSYSSSSVTVSNSNNDSNSDGTSSTSHQKEDRLSPEQHAISSIILVFIIVMLVVYASRSPTRKKSILKLQVGLLGSAQSLQRDLNRIAKTADTSKKAGFTYILTETTRALLWHPDYCISGYSSVDVKSNMDDCEKQFKRISIEEREKFDKETLVNLNNIKKQTTSSKKSTGSNNEYIVITILVAAEEVHKLPKISSRKDLNEALKKLGSIPTNNTLAVLWTPQDENDKLSWPEMLKDYPLLRYF